MLLFFRRLGTKKMKKVFISLIRSLGKWLGKRLERRCVT